MTDAGNTCLFSELQRFRQKWVWALVLIVAGIGWWGFVSQIILGQPFGDRPAPDVVICVLFVIFGLGFPWFFYSLRLVTRVDSDHTMIRLWPFPATRIFHRDIEKAFARQYHPIREYGGWGLRWSPRAGRAYNVSGNRGLQLELTNGKKVLIGSQKAYELEAAVKRGMAGNQ